MTNPASWRGSFVQVGMLVSRLGAMLIPAHTRRSSDRVDTAYGLNGSDYSRYAGQFPNTFLSRSLVRAMGSWRILASSWAMRVKRPSMAFWVM
jgi:hypothetical protein